jgi:hypothetical protein
MSNTLFRIMKELVYPLDFHHLVFDLLVLRSSLRGMRLSIKIFFIKSKINNSIFEFFTLSLDPSGLPQAPGW